MSQDAAVHYLREECRLGNQLVQQVWDVLLPVGHERFVVARPSAKSDDHHFLSAWRDHSAERGWAEDGGGRPRSRHRTQEVAATERNRMGNLTRAAVMVFSKPHGFLTSYNTIG